MGTDITVVEVYELASDIGRDLEKLIDAVGSDPVAELMPKVIRVLEQLEVCAKQREGGLNEGLQMQEELMKTKRVAHVASEENLRLIAASFKNEDVQLLDAQRQKEIKDWMAMAKELEQRNKGLKAQLSEKEGIVVREKAHEQQAMQVLYQLKETVDKQRDQLHAKDDELTTQALEVDALQQHVDRLAKVTADLRRKNELLNTMAKNFIQEKSELQSELRATQKQSSPVHHGFAGREILVQQQTGESEAEQGDQDTDGTTQGNFVTINIDGKAIIDLSDPERPRFTMKELQTVLQERDELKLDIMELEDELQQYRPTEDVQPPETEIQRVQPSGPNGVRPRSETSGIKKLFSFLFRGKNNAKPSPTIPDENTWEFLEKSDVTTDDDDDEVSRERASSATPVLSPTTASPETASLTVPVEEKPLENEKRRRSYTGPVFKVSTKQPFKTRERISCVRTESKKLIEVGQDILSMCDPDTNSTLKALAASELNPTDPRTLSRNNSNSSAAEIHSDVSETMMMTDKTKAVDGPTRQESRSEMPKITVTNNNREDVEIDM